MLFAYHILITVTDILIHITEKVFQVYLVVTLGYDILINVTYK